MANLLHQLLTISLAPLTRMDSRSTSSVLIITLIVYHCSILCYHSTDAAILASKPSLSENTKSNSFLRFTRTKNSVNSKIEAKSKDGHLRIKEKPPTEIITGSGSSRVLICEAQGSPPPKIHWLKDGQLIAQSIDELINSDGYEEKVTQSLGLSITASKLFLECLTPKDSGEYTCVAETPYRRFVAHSQVKVLPVSEDTLVPGKPLESTCLNREPSNFGVPSRIYMSTTTRLELIGSNALLYCRADGIPRPVIKWFGPDESQISIDSKYQILTNGDLVIRSVTWDDMGGYTCMTENQNGQDKTEMFLYPAKPEER